jgi:hypothetical protein
MNSAKSVILTAVNFKGIEQVKKEAKQLAEDSLCSESYVKSIIRQIEKGKIIIKIIKKGY